MAKMESENKVICPLAWHMLSVNPSGNVKVCPASQSSATKGVVKNDQGEVLNLGRHSVAEIQNSATFRQLRKNMLAGIETPDICQRCIVEEAANVTSQRQKARQQYQAQLETFAQKTEADGSTQLKFKHTDIRLGNKCNLKCRMCSPQSSSGWYEEYYETMHKGFREAGERVALLKDENGRVKAANNIFSWYENRNFWIDFENHWDEIQDLHFSGGEPLLIEEHYKSLESMVASGVASRVSLDYNTNLTVMPDRALHLWSHFKQVRLNVSIDGVGALNEYIRHPSKFEVIEKTLRKLDATPDNIIVWLSTTLQALNILHYPDLQKWILQQNFKKIGMAQVDGQNMEFIFTAHILREPKYMSVWILPKEYKDKVVAAHMEFLDWYQDYHHKRNTPLDQASFLVANAKNNIHSYLNFMNAHDRTELIPQFLKQMQLSDSYRVESLQKVLPDLYTSLQNTQQDQISFR